jgi:putative endonuclease
LNYKLLAQRYKTPYGELDLVMLKDKEIVFVEVKARKKSYKLDTIITQKQIQRNYAAAEIFLSENPFYLNYPSRFDLIIILDTIVAEHMVNITPLAPY